MAKPKWMLDLEIKGLKKGLRPSAFCRLAGFDPSCWTRWKKGQKPLYESVQRIEKVIEDSPDLSYE